MHVDRRRSPRIELVGSLHGRSVDANTAIKVREISLGGMAIETAVLLEAGAVHTFRLTLGDESTVDLAGRVMHCRLATDISDTTRYVSGVAFLDDDLQESPASSGDLGDLHDRLG
jgi:hypothetical protein